MFALIAYMDPYGTMKVTEKEKSFDEEGCVSREKGMRGGPNRTGTRDK